MQELVVETRHGRVAISKRGHGPAVLLLHGVPGSGATWERVAQLLEGCATVLVPDLLGFGASDRPADLPTLHAVGQAQALTDALAVLNVDSVTVVGHDFGGPVALMLSAEHPSRVARLGLLATNTFTDTPIPMPLSMLNWPVVGSLVASMLFSRTSLGIMLRTGSGKPRPVLDRASYLGDAGQVRAIRTIFEGSLRHLAELFEPIQEQLHAWSGPTFVAWGDRDPFFPLAQGRRIAEAARAPLVVLPGAGHFLPNERPERVADQITTLLQTPLLTGDVVPVPADGP